MFKNTKRNKTKHFTLFSEMSGQKTHSFLLGTYYDLFYTVCKSTLVTHILCRDNLAEASKKSGCAGGGKCCLLCRSGKGGNGHTLVQRWHRITRNPSDHPQILRSYSHPGFCQYNATRLWPCDFPCRQIQDFLPAKSERWVKLHLECMELIYVQLLYCKKTLMHDRLLVFQRPDIVLPVVQWLCRSTQSELTRLFSRGFLPRTHVRILRLDMCWSDKKWAPVPRSGCSA